MAAPYNPPAKGEDCIFRIALKDMANSGRFKESPTLSSADFSVHLHGTTATASLATTPSVSPAGSIWVLITLSSDEMNADIVSVSAIDQTDPPEWADLAVSIPTVSA